MKRLGLAHRLSGLALALFLPLHFWALGQAIGGEARLESFLRRTDQPLVKASEWAIVLLLPDRYQAVAHLHIEPPTVDQRVATIIPNGHVGQTSPEINSRYVPDKVAYLKGPRLAQDVAALPELQIPPEQQDAIAHQLMSLNARPQLNSGTFIVTLEGTDKARVDMLGGVPNESVKINEFSGIETLLA